VRLVVARCEVSYTGRLTAFLPESTRLLILKSDGSVLVHADAGGYKPLNWMTPPTTIEEEGDPLESIVVRKRAGKTEDRLEIRIHELVSDVSHEMGEAAALEKDGVERQLQAELADAPRSRLSSSSRATWSASSSTRPWRPAPASLPPSSLSRRRSRSRSRAGSGASRSISRSCAESGSRS
jgi:hypothetical protein